MMAQASLLETEAPASAPRPAAAAPRRGASAISVSPRPSAKRRPTPPTTWTCSAIALFTETGTLRLAKLSKYRPNCAHLRAQSALEMTVIHRLTLLWGVHPHPAAPSWTTAEADGRDRAERLLEAGGHVQSTRRVIAIVAGTRTKSGSTNFLRLHVLGDSLTEATSAREDAVARPRSKRLAKSKRPNQALPRRVRSGR